MFDQRNRRTTTRFETPPMYHGIAVRFLDEETFAYEGHAYNLSENGVCFELDRPIEPGTEVAIRIDLPMQAIANVTGPGRAVFAFGRIIWTSDVEEEGPVRMAMAIRQFCRPGDAKRLSGYLTTGQLRLAA